MLVDRARGTIAHHGFRDIVDLVPAGDVLVLNTTRVFRARLLGVRKSGAAAEVLLLKALGENRWEAMVHPGGKLKPGRIVHVGPDFDVEVLSITERRTRVVRLMTNGCVDDAIERCGHVPLPPYIARGDTPEDAERYQTVYAKHPGAVAAPTAGLHFDDLILKRILEKGANICDVTLHVGAGTFQPVRAENIEEHCMHAERYLVPETTRKIISGKRVLAVGTTTLRALESNADSGETDLFIYPGFRFRVVDRLLTNFHLPKSSLLMLVAAFAGLDNVRKAYAHAIEERYRFFSYGDAMLIERAR